MDVKTLMKQRQQALKEINKHEKELRNLKDKLQCIENEIGNYKRLKI